MTLLSILIPVFRESELLESLLKSLLKDSYEPKEILVVIDKPTQESLDIVEKMKDRVEFVINGERIGKANVLNELSKRSSGDVLLFLDSDIKIKEEQDSFLGTIIEKIKEVDILDVKKIVIRGSFLSRLVHYDYLSSNIVSWFFSKKVGKCLGLDGAAFAIKREAFERLTGFRRTVSEDLDLAIRSFIRNLSFRFTDKVTVFVKAPSGWREWYAQRKRWSIGTALWVKDHYAHLVRIIIKKPQVVLPSLLLVLPSLLLLSLIYLMPDTVYYHLIAFALTVLATFTSLALPPVFLTSFGIPIFKNLIAALLTFTIFSGVYYPLVRKMGSSFNPIEFLLFYFFYSPIVLLMTFIGLLKVVIYGKRVRTDWKV